ncbi:MAG: hypothetical protein IKO06_00185 [Alphaproteobacteria bacterium]|nr:hypothetical protein [Alphaproteobacteria bacterium]
MQNIENKPVYEEIRAVPALFLLKLSDSELKKLEGQIMAEIERATLSLKWVRGIQGIKKSGGYHGE